MLEQKVAVDTVAAAVDVDRSTLLTWWRNYRLIGPEARPPPRLVETLEIRLGQLLEVLHSPLDPF